MPLDSQKMGPGAVRICPEDNVAVAKVDLEPGHASLAQGPACVQHVPRGHKVALCAIAAGDAVIKQATAIGRARQDIQPGEHVHVHNLQAEPILPRDAGHYGFCSDRRTLEPVPAERRAVFRGIVREGGRVGTRNFIGLMPTVNGSATVARRIADHFNNGPGWLPATIDGVIALTHSTGCGMDVDSAGFQLLRRTLAGFACHPNFGGLILIGHGGETLQMRELLAEYPLPVAGGRLRTISMQEEGGSQSTIRRGIAEVAAMLSAVGDIKRLPVDAGNLIVGLKCGGSDAFSGLTANPALGHAVDLLVRNGGTAILGETPELFGAEHLLTRRAETPEVARALLERIDWWRSYAGSDPGRNAAPNPPGIDAVGLASRVEQSLGALLKGGTTSLRAVYRYAEPVTERGLVFMDSPGFDPCAATGQIAGGANLICFTTGRGSPFGCKPVPCLKLAATSQLFHGQSEDMDFNCGTVLDEEETLAECGERMFLRMLAVASGERTCSEALGYGDHEFVPWQVGAVF